MRLTQLTFSLLLILIQQVSAQSRSTLLQSGTHTIGYRTITVPYYNPSHSADTIRLVLNIWYPAIKNSGTAVRLIDYLHIHRRTQPDYDMFKENELQQFEKFTTKNFGAFRREHWDRLSAKNTHAFLDADFASGKFPLVMGRLRAFSTTFTNEFLASHGYIVCMLNGVEDYPPDNRPLYHRQVIREIEYYQYVRTHLRDSLQLTTATAGLLGFSGGGFAQFFAPMHHDHYDAVALLESGVFLDGDLTEIVTSHPHYNPEAFETPLLFLYNKKRFEENRSSQNFFRLKTQDKYLILFDDTTQHHWDFATEGMVSALYLHNRDEKVAGRQIENFITMNDAILKFFNQYLKNGPEFLLPKNQAFIVNIE